MKNVMQSGFGKVWVLGVIAVLVIGGLGFALTQSDDNEVAMQKNVATTSTTITTNDSQFGEILFDGNNQAIYIWEVEETSESECYDSCAVAWPPVLTSGDPVAAGGADASLLGTTERTDGTTQVTYNGHPLYYYDEAPGEVKCHNISTHGGLWWVVQPNGDRV